MKKLLIAVLVVGSLTLTPKAHAAPDAPVYGDMDSVVRTGQAIGYYASVVWNKLAQSWNQWNGVGF